MSQSTYEPYSSVSFHHKQLTSPYPHPNITKNKHSLPVAVNQRRFHLPCLSLRWWRWCWGHYRLILVVLCLVLLPCLVFLDTIYVYKAFFQIKLENTLFDRGWFLCGVLRKDPVLYVLDSHHIQVVWETNCGTEEKDMIISWHPRDTPQKTSIVVEPILLDHHHTIYKATLGPLNSTCTYSYSVEYVSKSSRSSGQSGKKRTLFSHQHFQWHATTTTQPIRIAAMADNQFGLRSFITLLQQIKKHEPPHYLLHAGDAVQNYPSLNQWHTDFLTPLTYFGFGQTAPMIYAHGNHDYDVNANYHYTRTSPSRESWYAFSLADGAIRFCVLDSNLDWAQQDEWLQQELASEASRSAAFRVVVVHIPPFLEYWDANAWFNLRESEWGAFIKTRFVPLFEKYNVDLVISGHQHNYERGEHNGIHYTIIGGAGGDIDFEKVVEWDMYEATLLDFHYVMLEFQPPVEGTPWRLIWNTYNLKGYKVDSMSLDARLAYNPPSLSDTTHNN
ncbi:Metallo-dependent phosphatase-like protein [Spinellus fusiger]|nr:Metallo-dependent phosphatase-like protein [Spinellus fusiger]